MVASGYRRACPNAGQMHARMQGSSMAEPLSDALRASCVEIDNWFGFDWSITIYMPTSATDSTISRNNAWETSV